MRTCCLIPFLHVSHSWGLIKKQVGNQLEVDQSDLIEVYQLGRKA